MYIQFVIPEILVQNFQPMTAPGSLRPLRTVRATFTAYGSGTFKADPVKVNPAVFIDDYFDLVFK